MCRKKQILYRSAGAECSPRGSRRGGTGPAAGGFSAVPGSGAPLSAGNRRAGASLAETGLFPFFPQLCPGNGTGSFPIFSRCWPRPAAAWTTISPTPSGGLPVSIPGRGWTRIFPPSVFGRRISPKEAWRIRFRPRSRQTGKGLSHLQFLKRKREKRPGEWLEGFDNPSICSYPPEDLIIEDYGRFLMKKGVKQLSEEQSRVEAFSSSMLDGIDMRETLRNLPRGKDLRAGKPARPGGRGEPGGDL